MASYLRFGVTVPPAVQHADLLPSLCLRPPALRFLAQIVLLVQVRLGVNKKVTWYSDSPELVRE